MTARLYRSSEHRIIGGVCGGLAEYFNIDPVIVRLIFVVLALAGGYMILVYIIGWIIIPARESGEAIPENNGQHEIIPSRKDDRAMWFGIILVLIGFGFMLDNFHIWHWWSFSRFWPVLLIIIGALILARAFSGKGANHESQ